MQAAIESRTIYPKLKQYPMQCRLDDCALAEERQSCNWLIQHTVMAWCREGLYSTQPPKPAFESDQHLLTEHKMSADPARVVCFSHLNLCFYGSPIPCGQAV